MRHPWKAFRAGPLIVRETVYGIAKRLEFFLDWIEKERKKRELNLSQLRILDVGCGTGVNVTIPLATAGYSLIGLDINTNSIERAKQLAASLQNIEFICGTLEQQTFGSDFHVVVCSEVLEHLEDPGKLLRAISDVLCDEGLLLVTVPNGSGYYELESLLWRAIQRRPGLERALYGMEYRFWRLFSSQQVAKRRSQEYDPERYQLTQSTLSPDQRHYQSFTFSSATRLFETHGFKVIAGRNGTLMGGNLIGLIAREFDAFLKWNADAADTLPHVFSTSWYFASRVVRNGSRF